MDAYIPKLLLAAVLLPFTSFWVILIWGPLLKKNAAYIATGAIFFAGVFSYVSLFMWLSAHWPAAAGHHGDEHAQVAPSEAVHLVAYNTAVDHAAEAHGHSDSHGDEHGHVAVPPSLSGVFYNFATFGTLRLDFSYYIDALTVGMFCMVTLIATLIHFYAMGYMHDEEHDIVDKEVTLANGRHLKRPGRFYRFFQYLSLFCFSMLGLVLAGNIALVFVFWELVGICSYFLIGFYVERNSASTAANKAFIVNRVGDFGMIIGLMAIWSTIGTFSFGDIKEQGPGLFSKVRSAENHYALVVPDEMVLADAPDQVAEIVKAKGPNASKEEVAAALHEKATELRNAADSGGYRYGYWLLVVAGVGIFCGCIGKSAQFPLHTWLPDAMEGPTPVSALVHSATMVAAGVYLTGRFYPVFAPETLFVIAIIGCITLFMAATIAITANDIKKVLAYSTISQLGYMMLALGVGGWLGGLMHLITHAFFKSLLFMCSGSVIHAVHTNDMRYMGGLYKKMPVTAITMLIGCFAIAGVSLPFVVGFSGYYSKDAILEQAYSLWITNNSPYAAIFFCAAAAGASVTAFYMFRMWYMTFVGTPRDQERYDHAHESPPVMTVPLVILAVFAVGVAWEFNMIGYALIAGAFFVAKGFEKGWFTGLSGSSHDHAHDAHGHDSHGHDAHGHESHGHDAHSHDAHGHEEHAHAHGHDDHAHDDHGHGHSEHAHHPDFDTGITLPWIATMLACTLIGGYLVSTVWPATFKINGLSLANLLEQARPAGTLADQQAPWLGWTWPDEHKSHVDSIKIPVTLLATGTWIAGIGLATAMYWMRWLNADEVRRQFNPIYNFLLNKWWFDELYAMVFVYPTQWLGRLVSSNDKNVFDWFLDNTAKTFVWIARLWEGFADQTVVDGSVNAFASATYDVGKSLKNVQTGRIRQYVMFIVLGAIALFVVISFFWVPALAK